MKGKKIETEQFSLFFKALGHPTRIMIVCQLLKGKKCVNEIREVLSVPQPNLSQHLTLLRFSGIVECHSWGKRKCYFLKQPKLIQQIFKKISKFQ